MSRTVRNAEDLKEAMGEMGEEERRAYEMDVDTDGQISMDGMPPLDAVARAAVLYLRTKEELAIMKSNLEDAASELAAQLEAHNRSSIKLDGVIITATKVDKTTLKVQRLAT